MALYDLYANYRDPNLTPDERISLDEAGPQSAHMAGLEELKHLRIPGGYNTPDGFVPDPLVAAHIGIAMDRAQAQFKGYPPMPEDQDVSIRFPGIDPVGKYGIIDMKFAQRQAKLEATLQTRPPEVQAYVRSLQDAARHDGSFLQVTEALAYTAQRHRILTRASKLCLNEDGRRLLHQQARTMESDLPVVQYDLLLQGMEYASGVREVPVPRDVQDFYAINLHRPIPQVILQNAGQYAYQPQQLNVEFQNFDHKLLQSQFANPNNWGKAPGDLEKDAVDLDVLTRSVSPYAVATADRVLSPAFSRGEDQGLSRADLILVDGITVREKMELDGMTQPTPQQIRERTAEYVAGALMAGNRVEAYVPDAQGRLCAQPTQITKTGYQPSPLKKVTLNAWERFFSQRGFYQEKTAQAEEYQRLMAGRSRVMAYFGQRMSPPPTPEQQQQLAAAQQSHMVGAPRFARLSQAMAKDADQLQRLNATLLGDLKTRPLPENIGGFRTGRSAPRSFCMGRLAEEGHSIQDILNPSKLQKEKAKMGEEYRAHLDAKDSKWYSQHMLSGSRALIAQVDKLGTQTDFANEEKFLQNYPVLRAASHAAFDLTQEMEQAENRPFVEAQLGGRDQLSDYIGQVNNRSALLNSIREGYANQMELYHNPPELLGQGPQGVQGMLVKALLPNLLRQDMAARLAAGEKTIGGQDFVRYGAVEVVLLQDQTLGKLAAQASTSSRIAALGDSAMAGTLGSRIPVELAMPDDPQAMPQVTVLPPKAPDVCQPAPKLSSTVNHGPKLT